MPRLTRTFLALLFDVATHTAIRQRADPLIHDLPSVRFVKSQTWHLTLAFLGDLTPEQLARVHSTSQVVASKTPPLHIATGPIGIFGELLQPTIIWLGLQGDLAHLHDLQQRLSTALVAEQLLGKRERFTPHVTLARPKHPITPAEQYHLQAAMTQIHPAHTCTITALHVMQSELFPDGPRYTSLGAYPFAE